MKYLLLVYLGVLVTYTSAFTNTVLDRVVGSLNIATLAYVIGLVDSEE